MKRFFRLFFGFLFLFLGFIGLFLPILQGLLFILIGLLILAPESRRIHALLEKLRKKYPFIFAKANELKDKLHRKISRK